MNKLIINTNTGEQKYVPLTSAELAALKPIPYQLAMQNWHEPTYSKRIEANIELLDPVNPNLTQELSDIIHRLYNYLKAQGLPEHSEKGVKYIYINVIQPQHQSFADSIDGLAITDRPKPEDYD